MGLNSIMPFSDKKVVPSNDDPAGSQANLLKQPMKKIKKKNQKQFLLKIVDHKIFNFIMACVTFYALFGDDFRLAVCSLAEDDFFFTLSSIALVLFTVEIILTSIAKPVEYRFKFYFWLDLMATISLIPDIGWLWNIIIDSYDVLGSESTEAALEASKASRNGARVGRIVRIVRLVRLVRIMKLFKAVKHDDKNVSTVNEPSNVGKQLSELTTRRVVVMVLIMLIALPQFDGGVDQDVNDVQDYGLIQLTNFQVQKPVTVDIMENMVQMYHEETIHLLHVDLCHPTCLSNCPNSTCLGAQILPATINDWLKSEENYYEDPSVLTSIYRDGVELNSVSVPCWADTLKDLPPTCVSVAYFSTKDLSAAEASANMFKTIFVMIVLAGVSILFNRDAEKLVIRPIQRMVQVVKELAADPLNTSLKKTEKDSTEAQGYETALLEATLRKIGMLLTIGFGHAGGEIIGKNLSNGGKLDPMIAGKKITGIFGFCDIRKFTDTTECLQEDVMVFVNRIGKIVHGATHQFKGAANKNIGDAFLLVWKVNANPDDPASWSKDKEVSSMVNGALAAFLKIIVDTEISNANGILSSYSVNKAIMKRFGPNYAVKMGFGLHIGWAIEGAIGTEFKIDASYLSAHVNMSGKLEESTKEYGVPLLLSGDFTSLLSPSAAKLCRKLDCVKIAGKKYDFHTFDITNIPECIGEPKTVDFLDYENDPHVLNLQKDIPKEFKPLFKLGVDAYLEGDWTTAKSKLEEALGVWEYDKPAKSLLRFMKQYDYITPKDWENCREI